MGSRILTVLSFGAMLTMLIAGTAAAPAATVPASANPASPTTSVKDLLSKGYEVKNVVFIPDFAQKAFQIPADLPVVMITMQAGPSVAVCQLNGMSWNNLNVGSMDLATQCSVYGNPPEMSNVQK